MNFAKRLLMVAGAVAVAAIVGVILTPRAAHAVVATVVQVVNTSTNPVPTEAVEPEPFSWEESVFRSATNAYFATPAFTVPSNTDGKTVMRLVIEGVSADCSGLSAPARGIRVAVEPADFSSNVEFFFPFPNGPEANAPVLGEPTRIYVNPGGLFEMNLLTFENSGVCSFSATGHYVTQ